MKTFDDLLDEIDKDLSHRPEIYEVDSVRGPGWMSQEPCPLCNYYFFDGYESVVEEAFYEHMEEAHQASRLQSIRAGLKVVKTLHSPVDACINGQVKRTICRGCSGDEAIEAIDHMPFMDWLSFYKPLIVEYPCRTIINVTAALGVSPE